MNRQISVTCGIYGTSYKLTIHRDGTVSVKAPYVKWVNDSDSGSLAFETNTYSGRERDAILAFFDADELALEANNNGGMLTLEDVLKGDIGKGVHVLREV